MNNVNRTLYIPLYGKAYVSSRGLFLHDPKAEQIWAAESFALRGKSKSKWLAYYMGIRSAVFDDWVRERIASNPDAVVLHIGCGMDSRAERIGKHPLWYDVDFPDVIAERKRYFAENDHYKMLAGDARDCAFLALVPQKKHAVVVMEGIGMYMTHAELQNALAALSAHFEDVALLMDAYSERAAQLSKYKNPINDVGVTQVWGIDDPTVIEAGGIAFVRMHDMTPAHYIEQLKGSEKRIFAKLYAGSFSRKLYRLYEYQKHTQENV